MCISHMHSACVICTYLYLYICARICMYLVFKGAVSRAYVCVPSKQLAYIQEDTVRYAPIQQCISACIWMYFETTYLHICTIFNVHICMYLSVFQSCIQAHMHSRWCAYLYKSNCISLFNTCKYFIDLCVLLRRIGRQQAHENQSGGVLDGQARMKSEQSVALVPPCPGRERTAQVARLPMCGPGEGAGSKANNLSSSSILSP